MDFVDGLNEMSNGKLPGNPLFSAISGNFNAFIGRCL